MKEYYDYLIHYQFRDSSNGSIGLTTDVLVLRQEEVTSIDDVSYMESEIENKTGFSEVTILAFSKIG